MTKDQGDGSEQPKSRWSAVASIVGDMLGAMLLNPGTVAGLGEAERPDGAGLPHSDARVARVPVAGTVCRGMAWRGRDVFDCA